MGGVNLGLPATGNGARPFAGALRAFTVRRGALDADAIKELWDQAKPLAKQAAFAH
jgi:hypothetical protein